jgi:hypothetical protein
MLVAAYAAGARTFLANLSGLAQRHRKRMNVATIGGAPVLWTNPEKS